MLVKEMHASMVANLDGAEPPYSVDKVVVESSEYDLTTDLQILYAIFA